MVSKEMREVLSSIADMTASKAAFAYVLGNPAIASCIFGTTDRVNLMENIAAADKGLDENSRLAIRKAFRDLQCVFSLLVTFLP